MLSTSTGAWPNHPTSYWYRWKVCNRFGNRCSTIKDARRSTYYLTSVDVGHTMRSVVTAQSSTGITSAESAPTPVVGAVLALLPPVDLTAPAVSGTPQDDQTLSTSTGSWLDSPTSYTYQWQDCDSSGVTCENISGADQSTYTLVDADIGQTIRSVVTATNSAGSASASSTRTGAVAPPPPPSVSAAPSVSGQTTQGQSLSTSNGSWTNEPSSYSYQWQTCDSSGNNCSNISSAAQSTYTLTAANVGHTLRSVVTATNGGGSGSASSAPTSVVTPTAPSSMAVPAVTGSTVQGQTLSTSNGSWTGSPSSYGYRWQDCNSSGTSCTTISGATSSSYTLQGSDVGDTIRSAVTATNGGGSTAASSAATGTVTAPATAPSNTAAPAVTGSTVQGQTLSTSNGSWTGSPSSYGYRWQDCNSSGTSCTTISGATSSSYTLQGSDVGDTIRSAVTATNGGGSTAASSAATGTVTAPATAPSNTAAPAVTGSTVQGQTLSTSNGSWTGSPSSYGYRWQDCNSSGTSCTTISGATSSSYTLQGSDVGDTIRSAVTATNGGGSTAASSAATGMVTGSGSGSGSGSGLQVGAPTPVGVTCSQTLNPGANVQSALSSASPGAVVCLNSGSWSAIKLSSVTPASPGVTLAATPGQTVVVPGFSLTGTLSNLTIEGFNITSPGTGNTDGGYSAEGIRLVAGSTGGLVIQYNTIANQGSNSAGMYISTDEGDTETGVAIQYNQIANVSTGTEIQSYGGENNLSFSHNVMEAVQNGGFGHYVEVNGGINGYTMNNNAILGPPVTGNCNPNGSASHLNVLHVDSGDILNGNAPETNISFSNNIIWHDQACGQAVLITDGPLSNVQTNNNLFVADPGCATLAPYACDASSLFVNASNGMTADNNTTVNELRGFVYGQTTQYTISDPNNMTAQYNIAAPAAETGDHNYDTWKCSSACNPGNNVSYDTSANTVFGGTGNIVNWTPAWQNTTWNPNTTGSAAWSPPPQGYYQPTTGGGVTPAYGYQGSICTASIRTNCIGP